MLLARTKSKTKKQTRPCHLEPSIKRHRWLVAKKWATITQIQDQNKLGFRRLEPLIKRHRWLVAKKWAAITQNPKSSKSGFRHLEPLIKRHRWLATRRCCSPAQIPKSSKFGLRRLEPLIKRHRWMVAKEKSRLITHTPRSQNKFGFVVLSRQSRDTGGWWLKMGRDHSKPKNQINPAFVVLSR